MKTIVGTWHDTRGNLAAWGKLHLVLNQDAHVILTAQVAPRSMTFNLDQNGSLMAGSKVWANDELDPVGTYYTATVTASGGGVIWGPQWVVIAGFDPVDLTSIVPLRMIPPLNQFSTSTTPAVFAMGVSDTPVSSELGFDPNAFMTVSDELILAPGANVLFSGSRSQHSMTVTINAIGGGGTGTGGAAFTAGIAGTNLSGAGTTVSNQLLIAGGSNITISRTTNAAGMTMSILGLSQGTGQTFQAALTGGGTVGAGGPVSNRLYLAGGNNVTLEGTTNANGMTVTINGEPQGTPSAPGGAVSLIEGANITITQHTDAAGTTATIQGASGNPWPTLSLITGGAGTIQGAANVTLSSLRLAAGSNILLAQNGNSLTINALATGGEATGGGGAVSFVAGSDISISQATIGGIGTTATISAIIPVQRSLSFAQGSNSNVITSTLSNSLGTTVTLNAGRLSLVTGNSHLTISSTSNTAGSTATLYGAAAGAGAGAMSLVEGNNITISQLTNASGTTATISGAAGQGGNTNVALSAFYIATGTGGTTSGNTAAPIGFSVLQLNAGRNMFFSGVSSATGFSVGMHALSRNVYAGPGIEISTASNSLGASTTITNVGGAGGGSVAITGLQYISTASFTNVSGTQFGFTGESGGGGSGSFGVGLSGGGAGSTAGNSAQTLQNAALRLVAGSNITLSGATNVNQHMTITINAAGGAGTGGATFSGGISGFVTQTTASASTQGNTGMVSNRLVLAAGSFVTLSGSSNTSGMSVSINAVRPMAFAIVTAPGGTTSGVTALNPVTANLQLAAGSNIRLSGATGTVPGNIGGTFTIDAIVSGGGAAENNRSLGPIIPMLPVGTSVNTFVKNSVLFWPILPLGLGSNFTAAVLPLNFNIGNSGTMRGSLGVSLGVYTRNGASLSQAGVTHSSWSYSITGPAQGISYNGPRNLVIPWNHNFNSAEDHWMAIRLTTNHSTYQSMDVSGICYQALEIVGSWGQMPAYSASVQPVPGWGILNSTTLPASLPMSVLNYSEDDRLNTPLMYFAGFSV